jgi:hypothetical protein
VNLVLDVCSRGKAVVVVREVAEDDSVAVGTNEVDLVVLASSGEGEGSATL